MVKSDEIVNLGGLRREGHGLSVSSETLGASSPVRRVAPSLQMQADAPVMASYGLAKTATLTILAHVYSSMTTSLNARMTTSMTTRPTICETRPVRPYLHVVQTQRTCQLWAASGLPPQSHEAVVASGCGTWPRRRLAHICCGTTRRGRCASRGSRRRRRRRRRATRRPTSRTRRARRAAAPAGSAPSCACPGRTACW